MRFEDVERHTKEAFNKGGYDFGKYNIELEVNGRLSTTLGRCMYKVDVYGKARPFRIELSKKLLENATEKEIIDVIYHEVAHALVAIETKERHGHDAYFKGMCARIGTTNDTMRTHIESYDKETKIFKYDVICPKCGIIGNYSRMCNTLRNIKYCSCGKCSSHLTYRQNY